MSVFLQMLDLASLWGWVERLGAALFALFLLVMAWRTKIVKNFVKNALGVQQLQESVQGLMEKQIELLQKEGESLKSRAEKAEEQLDHLREADAREMASLIREVDARRLINDQDTRIIDVYVANHGEELMREVIAEEHKRHAERKAAAHTGPDSGEQQRGDLRPGASDARKSGSNPRDNR